VVQWKRWQQKCFYLSGQCHPVTVRQIDVLCPAPLLSAVCSLWPTPPRHLADDNTAGELLVRGPCGVPLPAVLVLTSSVPKINQSLSVNKMQDIMIKCMMFWYTVHFSSYTYTCKLHFDLGYTDRSQKHLHSYSQCVNQCYHIISSTCIIPAPSVTC